MTSIKTTVRLQKADLQYEKSIAGFIDKPSKDSGTVITFSRESLKINTIRDIIPLARKKTETITQAIEYMTYVRGKKEDEKIVLSLAKPKKIVSVPSESIDSLVIKGVSVPLKTYSSQSLTSLASGALKGFDFLMSNSLSLVFGLIINTFLTYRKYKKVGASMEYIKFYMAFILVQAVLTFLLVSLVGFILGSRVATLIGLICALFFFILIYISKIIQNHRDRKLALKIDKDVSNVIYLKALKNLE